MPPAIVVFPRARYNYYIILTLYFIGYRNKNHIFREKISSHNYVATLKGISFYHDRHNNYLLVLV